MKGYVILSGTSKLDWRASTSLDLRIRDEIQWPCFTAEAQYESNISNRVPEDNELHLT
jgi:hypothetical protein